MDREHGLGWAPLTLVVGVDPERPDAARVALEMAGELRARGLTRSIVIAHVLSIRRARSRSFLERADGAGHEVERLALQSLLPFHEPGVPPLDEVDFELRFGEPDEELTRIAIERGADMIVIGPREGGLLHRKAGGLAARLLGRDEIPVMVARPYVVHAEAPRPDRDVPEPPCPDCLRAREESAGAVMWCARHSRPREPVHTYSPSTDSVAWTNEGALSSGKYWYP